MRFHLPRFGPELLILLGGLVFAVLGRGRWANVEADHGFWFSAAQSLVTGGRAMHEVRLQWGPGSLWILEAVGRLFGMHVASFVVFQFVVGMLSILGVQLFARRFLAPIERWICAAILVALIVWMVGSGNLLYPCAFAMSQALLLAIAVLILQGFVLRGKSLYPAIATGILAGLTLLTKQEFGVVAVLGIGCMTILAPNLDRKKKVVLLLAGGAACVATYFGILFAVAGGEGFRRLVRSNLLWPWAHFPGPWRNFYRKTLGLDDPGARVIEGVNSLVDLLAFGGTAWFVLYGIDLKARQRAAIVVGLVAAWILWWWRWTEGSHFLPMTLVLPVILTVAIWGTVARTAPASRGGPPDAGENLGPLLAIALGAVVLLQRVGYRGNINGSYAGIGYVLAVPVATWLIWRAIRGPRSAAGWRSAAALAILVTLVVRLGAEQWKGLEDEWRQSIPLKTARGTVYVTLNYAFLFSTYRFLESHTAPGDPILMMPQTFGLDFLLDRRNLSYFSWIAPGYLTDEPELIARLKGTPPRAAVVFEDAFGILHGGTFGSGFADAVVRWLETNMPGGEHSGSGAIPYERRYLSAPDERSRR